MGGAIALSRQRKYLPISPPLFSITMVESDLTEAEKAAIGKELPKFCGENSDAYYLILPSDKAGKLRKALRQASRTYLGSGFATYRSGAVVLVLARGKMARDTCLLFCCDELWVLCFCQATFLAISSAVWPYNQSLTLTVGDQLPEPLRITATSILVTLKEAQHQLAQTGNSLSSSSRKPQLVSLIRI